MNPAIVSTVMAVMHRATFVRNKWQEEIPIGIPTLAFLCFKTFILLLVSGP
jgi:hypothetical protein